MPSTVPEQALPPFENGDYLHVAVAVIENRDGEILIAKRHEHLHQGGRWEFPGGKVEPGELLLTALEREIKEELGIHIQEAHPLIKVPYHYPERNVLLDVWRVTQFASEAKGAEGQAIKWVRPEQLTEFDFPPANTPIITAAQLPDYYLITPDPGEHDNWQEFLQQLSDSLKSGVSLVQLRAPHLNREAYLQLANEVLGVCRRYGATLLLNGEASMLTECDADGIHLSSKNLMAENTRPVEKGKWLAASCHNREELQQAEKVGADFLMLSPVKPTLSHPGQEGMGWRQFRALSEQCGLPVYALGGMKTDDLENVWQHGAQGIAAIRALWGSRRSD